MLSRGIVGAGLALGALVVSAVWKVDGTIVATIVGGGLGYMVPSRSEQAA